MARYERTTGFRSAGTWPQVSSQRFDSLIAAIPDLAHWYDFHPSRVTLGSPISIADRKGIIPLVGVVAAGNPTMSVDDCPPGGALEQVAVFAADASLKGAGIMPTGGTSTFSQLIVFRGGNENINGTSALGDLVRKANPATISAHRLWIANSTVTARIGTTGSFNDVSPATARYALDEWWYFIRTYDQATGIQSLYLPGVGWATTTSAALSTSADAYLGGHDSAGSLYGSIGAYLQFNGTSGVDGDLSLVGRAADFATVKAYAEVLCGRFDMFA